MPPKVVVIDPGHGGTTAVGKSSANNATGPTGLLEKAVALDLGIRVAEILTAAGRRVLLTRNSDTNLGLAARAKVAADNDAEAFLSIHFNGAASPSVQGSETWVHATSTSDSRLLAASVQQRLVAATGLKDRGVKKKALGVLSLAYHNPTTAACLAEVSFITNPAEEARLKTAAYKQSIAKALGQAIEDYLSGSTSVEPADPVAEGSQTGEEDG